MISIKLYRRIKTVFTFFLLYKLAEMPASQSMNMWEASHYDSMIFSKINSQGGDFPRIIEIALLFHLQLY